MSWSSAVSVAIFITCAAFFFEAVGFAIPFWISTTYTLTDATNNNEETKFTTHVSIWYVMTCISGKADSCASQAIEPTFGGTVSLTNFQGSTAEIIVGVAATVLGSLTLWNVLQIVSTVGVGICGLAMLILICCRCAGIHSQCWFVTSLLLLIFGVTLVVGITILDAIGYGTAYSFAPGSITAETFPWSLLLFGIGGFLGIIAIILLFVITCAWRKYGAYEEDDRVSFDDMPMSDRKHTSHRQGYDNPRYPDPYDPRKEYYEYDKGRSYDYSRESGKYNDYIDDYRDSSRNYRDAGYSSRDNARDYRPDYRETRDDTRYYSPGRSYAADNMYRPYSQYRY